MSDNPLAWKPNPRLPIQVRVHRLDGVAVWSDHRSLAAAERSALHILHAESVCGRNYVGPNDLVEIVDTRKPTRPRKTRRS